MHASYKKRVNALAEYLRAEEISAALFVDIEGSRDPSIRYYTGQPQDAVLIITNEGKSVLAAWDINLARSLAHADALLPFTDYGRSLSGILTKLLPEIGIESGMVELPVNTGYVDFVSLSEMVPELELVCHKEGASRFTEQLRMIKDDYEIAIYRELSNITNTVIEELEKRIRLDELRTEMDVALFLERTSREFECEGMSFETLCAGPARSHNIHAFPPWTKGPFGGCGLSLVDFGLRFKGYSSDITLTVASEPLNNTQKKMLALVERAYSESFAACVLGAAVNKPAAVCDTIFSEAGFIMPHSLGHGLGLETHEAPILRNKPENLTPFEQGMVFTLEPGLYHPESGGVRWENDFLMTETGPEQVTRCTILYR